MTPTERVITFRPDVDILDAMSELKERDGVPFSEQIRRALREWLTTKAMLPGKSSARRGVQPPRRRSGKSGTARSDNS